MPLDFFPPDECCAPAWNKAMDAGKLDNVDEWKHEKCGQVWRAYRISEVNRAGGETIREWMPVCEIVVFQ
jgi:hypothetical protein